MSKVGKLTPSLQTVNLNIQRLPIFRILVLTSGKAPSRLKNFLQVTVIFYSEVLMTKYISHFFSFVLVQAILSVWILLLMV